MRITKKAYLDELRRQVSAEERKALENGEAVPVSRYNRETMLRMLRQDAPAAGLVDPARAEALRRALVAYLGTYMPDCPQGHKWIILSCLFLAMVACEPMHPQAVTGWEKRGDGYVCRAREDGDGSVCRWCVCRKAEE
jgi:uncharacterized protein (UPF0305 family)